MFKIWCQQKNILFEKKKKWFAFVSALKVRPPKKVRKTMKKLEGGMNIDFFFLEKKKKILFTWFLSKSGRKWTEQLRRHENINNLVLTHGSWRLLPGLQEGQPFQELIHVNCRHTPSHIQKHSHMQDAVLFPEACNSKKRYTLWHLFFGWLL